jgi:hypothetical protein
MYDLKYIQKLQKDSRLQDLEWGQCANDPYHFMTHWALTLDVHDRNTPIKTFPTKEYIKILIDLWLKNPLLLVPKSRQMLISWIFTTLYLWDNQFHKGRLTFFQSKKADDADDLIKRAKFVWDHEPKFLKRYYDGKGFRNLTCNPQHNGQHVYCKMDFPDINSEIRGIPEGGDVIRMHTASGILADEMAFQPEAFGAYQAAKPTISSHGKFTGVSTAEDNTFFEDMVFDKLEV